MPRKPSEAADLHLLVWLSPAFPVGGFAYSHGLETAVDQSDVHDVRSLGNWIDDLLACGSARNDAVLAAVAWAAASAGDASALDEANSLALALAPSRERHLETSAMGTAFAQAIRNAWPEATCPLWPRGELAYPVAFGAACATAGVGQKAAIRAFTLAFVQNLISAAVRLGVVGQTDGQRVTRRLLPGAAALAEELHDATLDDLGACAQRSDIAAMRHETQYSRLFRS